MNEKDQVGEAKSRSVLLWCVSLEHPKSMRGRRVSYILSLNKQEQFLVCTNYNPLFRFPKTHWGLGSIPLPPSQGRIVLNQLPHNLELEEVSGFVTRSHNNQWWLQCVIETHTEAVQISLTLLHPPGPSRSYKYPDVQVVVTLPLEVCPCRWTGRVYTLTQKDTKARADKLETTIRWNFVSIACFVLSTISIMSGLLVYLHLPYLA